MSLKRPRPIVDLLILARTGGDAARGELLEVYRDYLHVLAHSQIRRHLGGKVDPEDIVQETFLEACRDFEQFRGSTAAELMSWLRQILQRNLANTVRHFLGTQRRDLRVERELSRCLERSSELLNQGLVVGGNSPSESAVRREHALLLASVLAQLPDHYRTVIELRHLEELTFPEIAERMGQSVDGVKKLWARAVARLQTRLRRLA